REVPPAARLHVASSPSLWTRRDGQPLLESDAGRASYMEPGIQGHRCAVDIWLVVAGALFVLWPLQYRRSIRKIHERIADRGGDVDRFKRRMDRVWIPA